MPPAEPVDADGLLDADGALYADGLLDVDGCLNLRDVGGWALPDGRRIRRGVLYRRPTTRPG